MVFWWILRQQVRRYYGSGSTGAYSEPMTSHALGGLAGHPADAAAYSGERRADFMAAILLLQSMRIYLKNNLAKFHSDPIRNDGAEGFIEQSRPQQEAKNNNNNNNNEMSSNVGTKLVLLKSGGHVPLSPLVPPPLDTSTPVHNSRLSTPSFTQRTVSIC